MKEPQLFEFDCAAYGAMVKEQRENLGLTEEKLAELSEISDREVRNIEAGNSIPKLDNALKISRALRMNSGVLEKFIIAREDQYV